MKHFFILIIMAAAAMLFASPQAKAAEKNFRITISGESNSLIVIEDSSSRVVWQAARELQHTLRLLTGARITIRNAPSFKGCCFILGTPDSKLIKPVLKGRALKLVKSIKDDGYAVLVQSNRIYIIGAVPRGVLNGVHRFILKHTDFIWVRPYKELASFTFAPDLKLRVKDHVDNPVFRLRSWLANGKIAQRSEEFFIYCVRNGINYLPGGDEDMYRSRYTDNGMFVEFGGGHNMSRIWLPRKTIGKTNPEFYMQIDGKRVVTGRVQLCYANEKMHEAFIANTLKIAKDMPAHFNCLNIMIDDTQSYCECEKCMAPIKLPDGRLLKRSEESFKSTQFFIFLNKVAAAVKKAHPDMKIKCFGYFFTAIPPEIPIDPSIRVSYCPYIRNDKETLHGPSNSRWLDRTMKYTEMSSSLIWREYYFSRAAFPRAQANIIAQDLRFIFQRGIREVSSENNWGDRPGMPIKGPLKEFDFFNITGAEFWTITQLFWDPFQDPDALRNEYIKRVYHEAAPGVMKFYKLLRDSWLNDPSASVFNDDFRRSMGRYVIGKKLTGPCRQALAEAAAAVKHPVAAEQLAKLSGTFEKWLTLAADSATPEYRVKRFGFNDFPGFDFNAGVWKKAAALAPMYNMGTKTPAAADTLVKIIHNGKNLYVAVQCRFPNNKTTAKAGVRRDEWPGGDLVELFFARSAGGYYHLVFNAFADSNSSRYDAFCSDAKWNGEWDVKTQYKNGVWKAVATVPFKTIDCIPEMSNRLSALIYRVQTRRTSTDVSKHFTWGGGAVHSPDSFGDLIIALE